LALFFEVYPVMDSGWLWLPLTVLLVAGLGPAAWILKIKVPGWLSRHVAGARERAEGRPGGSHASR
jgi:hypothetical protein